MVGNYHQHPLAIQRRIIESLMDDLNNLVFSIMRSSNPLPITFIILCLALPRRMLRQILVELRNQFLLVFAGIGAIYELVVGLLVEPLPGLVLVAGVDRVEEALVGPRGLEIAGGIADHQHVVRLPSAIHCKLQMLGLAAHLLAGDHFDVTINAVLLPLAYQCLGGGLGTDYCIRSLRQSSAGSLA